MSPVGGFTRTETEEAREVFAAFPEMSSTAMKIRPAFRCWYVHLHHLETNAGPGGPEEIVSNGPPSRHRDIPESRNGQGIQKDEHEYFP